MSQFVFGSTQAMIAARYPSYPDGNGATLARVAQGRRWLRSAL